MTNPTPEQPKSLIFRDNTPTPPNSPALTQRQRIQQAAFYGHDVRNDPERKAVYDQHTDEILRSPYAVAVADYLNAPNITNVDFSAYHGQIGDCIAVEATDDFAVHHVHVRIQNPDGTLVEEGDAAPQPDGRTFHYLATATNASLAGDKITITAADNPGNETSRQEEL